MSGGPLRRDTGARRESIERLGGLRAQVVRQREWPGPFAQVLDGTALTAARRFSRGALDKCAGSIDPHVTEGRGNALTVTYDSPVARGARWATDAERGDEVAVGSVGQVNTEVGPVSAFKLTLGVPRPSKTRSGRIRLELTRTSTDGEAAVIPATIEDASMVDDLSRVLMSEEAVP